MLSSKRINKIIEKWEVKSMSVENNKAIARRLVEAISSKRIMSSVSELIDANIAVHTTMGDFKGYEGFKQFITPFYTAFPDMNLVNDDEIAEGDKVMFRQTFTGIHKGSLMSIPPTGKKFVIQEMVVNRFVNGKVVETWALADLLGMMQQLGLAPPMGQK
jgi:predicted ester cyclase